MSYNPKNPNGQATSANSEPVVIASDQSAVPVSGTITANAGTNLNTSALALDTSVDGLLVGQGSTTSGQKGPIAQGAATTSAPTYTNGQTSPLSLDTSGNLRTSVNNTVTVGGTVTTTPPSNASTNIAQIGGSAVALGNTTMSGSLPVTLASNDTNTAPFVAAGGGGYVRQDSTGTIAKESGGNLATIAGAISSAKMNVQGSATAATAPGFAIEDGGIASTSLPTATSNGQLTGLMVDKFGRVVTLPQSTRDIVGQQSTTITASTASTTVVTGISNVFADISSIVLANSGTSATLVTLSDGTNSYYFYVPAGDTRGATYQVPLPATTVATNWTVTCGTSTSSLYVTVEFIKNR